MFEIFRVKGGRTGLRSIDDGCVVKRWGGSIQALVVIRETITARAIRTPHRHFSHTTSLQLVAQPRLPSPAPVVETARPFRGRMAPTALGTSTGGCTTSVVFGVGV